MSNTYYKLMPGTDTWEEVKSLGEIPMEAWPHVFALEGGEVFECPEPIEFIGVKFKAGLTGFEEPYSPMIAKLCLRLQQAELDAKFQKEQAGQVVERDIRFKRVAEGLRDRIVKKLAMLATSQAAAFEGTHHERHTKLAAAMVQIPEIIALCGQIPGLLVDAAEDIPF